MTACAPTASVVPTTAWARRLMADDHGPRGISYGLYRTSASACISREGVDVALATLHQLDAKGPVACDLMDALSQDILGRDPQTYAHHWSALLAVPGGWSIGAAHVLGNLITGPSEHDISHAKHTMVERPSGADGVIDRNACVIAPNANGGHADHGWQRHHARAP